MREKIDCFLPCNNLLAIENTLGILCESKTVQHINLLVSDHFAKNHEAPENCSFVIVDHLASTDTILSVEENTDADYVLLNLKPTPIVLGAYALERFLRVASDSDGAMVYSDHYCETNGTTVRHALIDYQQGSVREDFDFGQLILFKAELLHQYVAQLAHTDYQYAGFYDFRLFLSRNGGIFHINEYLYTEQGYYEQETDDAQFEYPNPLDPDVQMEMEKAVTAHLSAIGALVDTTNYQQPDFYEQDFDCEASVIIPVFNREETIADAIKSALGQKTFFKYNVIVVDNHSTDRTSEIIESLATDKRLLHLVPERTDLCIGGCWNMAINDDRCGRFAVQLDSDDLYSSPHVLQKIVEAFHRQRAVMIIGSYRLCDFELNTLSPGLIDHREWTEENGCNNALRINELGAPCAFFTPLARQIQFPNTSYGEDYAIGLLLSRKYRIGRIYDELAVCRRRNDDMDAVLSPEKVNANNLYKDRLRTMEISARQQMLSGKADIMTDSLLQRFFNRQLERWDDLRKCYRSLQNVKVREVQCGDNVLKVQYNPVRMISTGANIDKDSLDKRPCFLCEKNRPKAQMAKNIDNKFDLLVNPFPILPMHFTIPAKRHVPQEILHVYGEIHRMVSLFKDLTVFYNGPLCGASAPDHLHLQAGTTGLLPLQTGWQRLSRNLDVILSLNDEENISVIREFVCPAFLIRSKSEKNDIEMFHHLYYALPKKKEEMEPMMNIVSWMQNDEYLSVVFPRKKHRPDCYSAEGDAQILVSPGALDMSGLVVTPRAQDFKKMNAQQLVSILQEVCLSEKEMEGVIDKLNNNFSPETMIKQMPFFNKQPQVAVGIVSGQKIHFALNTPYIAKGEEILGDQIVEFSEGGILWNGSQYRELTFHPQSPDASFSLFDVTIGVNFHWERKETQVFQGTLRLVVEADSICAINDLPVENYLESVISSEMSATSSIELLKAHAVISRSWLLSQMARRQKLQDSANGFFSFIKKDDEIIRWYDREDHTIFDVCADDHCQRYQGITKETSPHVVEAVKATRGQILMSDGEICDARFSKSCGGVSEEYQYCWDNTPKSYLTAIRDDGASSSIPDLTNEENARKWICSSPESFCNTHDKQILSQVLNDYDQETTDFYRWHVAYTQEQISALINDKMKLDFGKIVDLIPLERGKSGRISKLKIVGTERSFTIGKELEIRRTLSETHLYSSAFVVDKSHFELGIPQQFDIYGAGWGHGVGLCQIGAAVMGAKGYDYDQILLHYFKGAEIKKIYNQ